MSMQLLEPDEGRIALAPVTLTVNGRRVAARVEPRTHLADFLREGLDLTGTHLGCEHGICGACTVLIDGEPARACISFAAGCDGAAITTIEGLDDDETTVELRAAFTREHALQCGYCTPGMLVAARDLVLRLPEADERRVRLGLSGNLCRCTGYVGIVRAVVAVLRERRTRGIAPKTRGHGLGPVGSHPAPHRAEAIGDGRRARIPLPEGERSSRRSRPGEGDAPCPDSAQPPHPALSPSGRGFPAQAVPDFVPAHSFDQHFAVPFPPDEVFALFGRVQDVAACLPGASITAEPAPGTIEGAIRVKLGPISAAFKGTALIERDAEALSGRILGTGRDGGRSSTQGIIRYRVRPGASDASAEVELSVGYTLKGPLAQFGRPGLVRDLAGRITNEFVGNIAATLAGSAPPRPARSLDTLSLASGLVRGWIAATFGSWFRRKP